MLQHTLPAFLQVGEHPHQPDFHQASIRWWPISGTWWKSNLEPSVRHRAPYHTARRTTCNGKQLCRKCNNSLFTFAANFKKEVVARTVLQTMCQSLVSNTLYACHVTRTKHIYLGGSFVPHPLTQRLLMEEFENKKLEAAFNIHGLVRV